MINSINNAQSVGYGQMWPAQIIHLAIACLPASDSSCWADRQQIA